eukprot:scaffold44242_cov38-Prasinocladus_malaysianus.AAC.1
MYSRYMGLSRPQPRSVMRAEIGLGLASWHKMIVWTDDVVLCNFFHTGRPLSSWFSHKATRSIRSPDWTIRIPISLMIMIVFEIITQNYIFCGVDMRTARALVALYVLAQRLTRQYLHKPDSRHADWMFDVSMNSGKRYWSMWLPMTAEYVSQDTD